MRRYDLFIIKAEVAQAYFGKEVVLNQLFYDAFHETHLDQCHLLDKQVAYITKGIPTFRMGTLLRRSFNQQEGYTITFLNDELLIQSKNRESQARLKMGETHLTLWSSGSLLAESYLFEKLRQIDPYLLAVDRNQNRCGWLRPIKSAFLIEG